MAASMIPRTLTGIQVIEEHINISFDAGTIGTRGAQVALSQMAPTGKRLISAAVVGMQNSSAMMVIPFVSSNTLYVNAYRATNTQVSNQEVIARFVFADS